MDAYVTDLRADLEEPYHDRFAGGIVGYLNHVANVYSTLEMTIRRHPDCGISIPTDKEKMIQVMQKVTGHSDASLL